MNGAKCEMDDLSYPNHRMKSKQFSPNSGNLRPNGSVQPWGAVGGHAYQVRTISHTEPPHERGLMGCTQRWRRSQALSSVRAGKVHCLAALHQEPWPTTPNATPSQKCQLADTSSHPVSPSLILDPPGPHSGTWGEDLLSGQALAWWGCLAQAHLKVKTE